MKFDIVIPSCKKDQFILNKEIDSIFKFIKDFRRIIVVSDEKLTDKENVEWFDEKQFPFSKDDIYENLINVSPDKNRRKKTCYINQLIKLYAHRVIPDLLENILICDSDLIFIKETNFFSDNFPLYSNKKMKWSKGVFYFNHITNLNGDFNFKSKVYDSNSNTYESGICHHMIINKYIMDEIINLIEDKNKITFWKYFLNIVSNSNKNNSLNKLPSEYELYYNYIKDYHSDKIKIRKLTWKESPAESGKANNIIKNYDANFDEIRKLALKRNNNYIAFHSYNR